MTDVKLKKNIRCLNKCLDLFRCTSDAHFALLMAGKKDEANKLDKKLEEMERDITKLRGKILDDWLAKKPSLLVDIGKIKTEAQDAADDIRDDIATAQRVVELIGAIDDALALIGQMT
nr:hypothetical protein [uncultured Desulfobacter sp.]